MTYRDSMPEALTINASSGAERASTVPASMSAVCSPFHFSTDAVSEAASSALLIDSGGVNRPVPVIDTDGNTNAVIWQKLRAYPPVTPVRGERPIPLGSKVDTDVRF
jgi:hypothetical protein